MPVESPKRQRVIDVVADMIASLPDDRVRMVAVDGVDGAGKTTFADELAVAVGAQSAKAVIRASVDSFHNPSFLRYRLGRRSPEGFFRESYDYQSLKSVLLDPLRTGTRRYRAAVFDTPSDTPVAAPEMEAAAGSVLVFDGIFLHRTDYAGTGTFRCF